jgi:hypothetical protein
VPANRSRRRLFGLLIVSIGLPLGVSACSSSSTAGGTTTTAAASGPNSVCSVVTPAQIEATLGKQVAKPTAVNSTASTACTYLSTTSSDKSDSVIIVYRGGVTKSAYSAQKATLAKTHGSITDVSGVGDTAYYYTVQSHGQTVTSLVTLVNQAQVSITSTATVAQAEALAKQIFATFASDATSTTPPAG